MKFVNRFWTFPIRLEDYRCYLVRDGIVEIEAGVAEAGNKKPYSSSLPVVVMVSLPCFTHLVPIKRSLIFHGSYPLRPALQGSCVHRDGHGVII